MAEDQETQEAQQEVRHVDPSSGAASQPGAAIVGDKPTAAYDDEADLTVAPAWQETGFTDPDAEEESEESEESEEGSSEEDGEADEEPAQPEPEPESDEEPAPQEESQELTPEQQATLDGLDYQALQAEAREQGIPANQTKVKLAQALGKI